MSRRDFGVRSRARALDGNDFRRPGPFNGDRYRLLLRSLLSLELIPDENAGAKANRAADQSASAWPIHSAANSRSGSSASEGANACGLLSCR